LPSTRRNPRNIVATWIQDVGPDSSRTDLIASSGNGGKTWVRHAIPGLTRCEGGSADSAPDPWVGAGADGELYFTGLAPHFIGDAPWSAVAASHSGDGGRSWYAPVTLAEPKVGNETPMIIGSRTGAGRAAEVWAEFATGVVKLSSSRDHGATWSPEVEVDSSIPNAIDLAPRLLVLPNRTLVTIFARAEFRKLGGIGNLYATHSNDGRTWTAAVKVATQPIQTYFDDRGDELPQPQYPSAAVAPDGIVNATVEANQSASPGVISVFRSPDAGVTWHRVTSPGAGAYAFEPTIAVDAHGTVGMTWYDLRKDRSGDAALNADVWFASSRDGGASWHEEHVAGSTDLRTGALAR
jgi:hypothetical protein